MAVPEGRNLCWWVDFVEDTLMSGRRFRVLTLVDDFTRECLDLVVDTSLTGLRSPALIFPSEGKVTRSNRVGCATWHREGLAGVCGFRQDLAATPRRCGSQPKISKTTPCKVAGGRRQGRFGPVLDTSRLGKNSAFSGGSVRFSL